MLDERAGAFIYGDIKVDEFDLTIDNAVPSTYGDDVKPPDIAQASVEYRATLELGKAEYLAYMRTMFGVAAPEVTLEVVSHPGPRAEGRRCLWGQRRGYIQVGSEYDLLGPRVTIRIPRVSFVTNLAA